jgi:hypothetical protein
MTRSTDRGTPATSTGRLSSRGVAPKTLSSLRASAQHRLEPLEVASSSTVSSTCRQAFVIQTPTRRPARRTSHLCAGKPRPAGACRPGLRFRQRDPIRDLTSPPVDVIQSQRRHLAGAQPEPGQQGEDGQVPPPGPGERIAGGQQRGHLISVQRPRHPGLGPPGRRGHRQRLADQALGMQEAEQGERDG